MPLDVCFRAPLWLWDGKGAWHFITLPKSTARSIREDQELNRKPFGSVRVAARIGSTRWQTSLFPDTKTGSYLLPVKATVRSQEQLRVGDEVEVVLVS
jgi:Domain of unknown function (DUF1905)